MSDGQDTLIQQRERSTFEEGRGETNNGNGDSGGVQNSSAQSSNERTSTVVAEEKEEKELVDFMFKQMLGCIDERRAQQERQGVTGLVRSPALSGQRLRELRLRIEEQLEYPDWFFLPRFSPRARSLLSCMLEPDATFRISVREARKHPFVTGVGALPLEVRVPPPTPKIVPLAMPSESSSGGNMGERAGETDAEEPMGDADRVRNDEIMDGLCSRTTGLDEVEKKRHEDTMSMVAEMNKHVATSESVSSPSRSQEENIGSSTMTSGAEKNTSSDESVGITTDLDDGIEQQQDHHHQLQRQGRQQQQGPRQHQIGETEQHSATWKQVGEENAIGNDDTQNGEEEEEGDDEEEDDFEDEEGDYDDEDGSVVDDQEVVDILGDENEAQRNVDDMDGDEEEGVNLEQQLLPPIAEHNGEDVIARLGHASHPSLENSGSIAPSTSLSSSSMMSSGNVSHNMTTPVKDTNGSTSPVKKKKGFDEMDRRPHVYPGRGAVRARGRRRRNPYLLPHEEDEDEEEEEEKCGACDELNQCHEVGGEERDNVPDGQYEEADEDDHDHQSSFSDDSLGDDDTNEDETDHYPVHHQQRSLQHGQEGGSGWRDEDDDDDEAITMSVGLNSPSITMMPIAPTAESPPRSPGCVRTIVSLPRRAACTEGQPSQTHTVSASASRVMTTKEDHNTTSADLMSSHVAASAAAMSILSTTATANTSLADEKEQTIKKRKEDEDQRNSSWRTDETFQMQTALLRDCNEQQQHEEQKEEKEEQNDTKVKACGSKRKEGMQNEVGIDYNRHEDEDEDEEDHFYEGKKEQPIFNHLRHDHDYRNEKTGREDTSRPSRNCHSLSHGLRPSPPLLPMPMPLSLSTTEIETCGGRPETAVAAMPPVCISARPKGPTHEQTREGSLSANSVIARKEGDENPFDRVHRPKDIERTDQDLKTMRATTLFNSPPLMGRRMFTNRVMRAEESDANGCSVMISALTSALGSSATIPTSAADAMGRKRSSKKQVVTEQLDGFALGGGNAMPVRR